MFLIDRLAESKMRSSGKENFEEIGGMATSAHEFMTPS